MFSSGNDTAALMRSLGMAGSGRRRVARRRGGNIFSSIGNWVKGAANTVYNKALKPAARFIKNNHLISTAVGLLPHPAGRAAGIGLRLAGYGRRTIPSRSPLFRVAIPRMSAAGRRRRRGGELTEWDMRSKPKPKKSLLRRVHDYVKDKRLISSTANQLGFKRVGAVAQYMGYGRSMKRRGGRIIGPMNRPSRLRRLHDYVKEKKLISHTLNHMGFTKASTVAAALGYGRSMRRRGGLLPTIAKPPVAKSRLRRLHNFVKEKKLISHTLAHLGYTKASAVAASLGYGRRVVRRRIRRY